MSSTTNTHHLETSPLIKWGWLRAVFFFVGGFGVMFVVRILKRLIIYSNENLIGFEASLISELITFAGFLVLIVLFRKFVDRKSFISLGFTLGPLYQRHLLFGLGAGYVMIALLFSILTLSGTVVISEVRPPDYNFFVVTLLFVVVALSEELIWRGYMLNNFMTSMNKYWAIVVPSLMFTLLHADSPTATVLGLTNVFLAGVLFSVYYVHQKNLWFPISFHFAWNFSLGPVFGSAVSGNKVPSLLQLESIGNESLTGGGFGFEGSFTHTSITCCGDCPSPFEV